MTDKKPPPETNPEQSERFRKAVRDLEAAGELSHTDEGELTRLVQTMQTRAGRSSPP